MSETILICCFDFPPNQGIGGRRWAKFAKQLARRGYNIQVIKADPIRGNKDSAWTDDIADKNIEIHSIPRNYPEAISHPSKGIKGSIAFRLAVKKLNKKVGGTIFDLAVNFESGFRKKAAEILSAGDIRNVMVTGAPFNLAFFTSRLKEDYPDLNIITDYRDPWITAQNYGMPQLTDDRMSAEIDKQDVVFRQSSFVTCPNEYLLEEIRETARTKPPKAEFKVLEHFFDPDEIDPYLKDVEKDDKIRFVYGGALYMGLDPYLKELRNFLDGLKKQARELYNRLEFEIYTRDVDQRSIFEGHESVVKIEAPIGNKLFERLNVADYAIIFLSHHNKDFKTTKYFEFLPFGIPLVYIGNEGQVAKSIESNKLGVVIRDFDSDLRNLLEQPISIDPEHIRMFAKRNSLEKVTDDLIALFK